MIKKNILIFTLTLFAFIGFAQTDIDGKLTITTQMFLDEINGKIEISPSTKSTHPSDVLILEGKAPLPERFYAAPDTIDGKVYISCFVRLENNDDTHELEEMGVVVQERFINGLVTALIPIDNIEEVASIANVSRINVSPLMTPLTDIGRQKTNVDDVLTYSDEARAAGLSQGYDGSGVLMAVIDDGIDFQHIAFKDKNGNSRIKRAYVYNGSNATEYSTIGTTPTTDDAGLDHGTHTCTTAGGSSVIVSDSSVTVTDDHANATYGGMAPCSDLYLAGIKNLSSTYISNAFAKIIQYADDNQQPVVVSNSWGSQYGPHDGTSDMSDVLATYFGSDHPNHICLFAASNDAGKAKDNESGGYFITGTASESNPLRTIIRSHTYSNTDAGYYYKGVVANAWCQSSNDSSMECKIHVLDCSTGEVLTSITVTPSAKGASVSGLGSYFSGTLLAYKDYVDSDKTQLMLFTKKLTSNDVSKTTKNGKTYYVSKYTLAVDIYPTSGSAIVDVWGGSYCYFSDYLNTSGYSWKAGSDDMCVSDEATDPNVISIGAYVSKNVITDYTGTTYDYSDEFTVDDIAYFSSYATANASPTGLQYPWISAPGARIVAGVNSNSSSYTTGSYTYDRVNNNTTYPYAAMNGTSMATPIAAGIVALWLQAAKEVNKEMTVEDIKDVMKQTAINDYYTQSGSNASHFGNGKIDALAGIQYILGTSAEPFIKAEPTDVHFEGYATRSYTKTVNVKGFNLEGDITVSLNDPDNVYQIDKSQISSSEAVNGVDITVSWMPATAGLSSATVTLSNAEAESVILSIDGQAGLIGDVNRDGLVDINDVTAMIDIILSDYSEWSVKFPNYDFVAADVNNDGSIDINDVTALVDIILAFE